MARPLSPHPFLTGRWEPWNNEGYVHDLVLTQGRIPEELSGTLFRNSANPQYQPLGGYSPMAADGMVHAFTIGDGRVSFRNRWVRTPRFVAERTAGDALFEYEGQMTDWRVLGWETPLDKPETRGIAAGAANINVVCHGGQVMALGEFGGPPMLLDPDTLDTLGPAPYARALGPGLTPNAHDQDGTTGAHPKIDPETGEMITCTFSAVAPYVTIHIFAADGTLTRSVPLHDAPGPGRYVHDFVVTATHIIVPLFGAAVHPENARRGRSILSWEPELGTHFAVLARDGADITWIHTEPLYAFHFLNAHDDGDQIVIEAAEYDRLPLPAENNEPGQWKQFPMARLARWILDVPNQKLVHQYLDDRAMEFPRLDERLTGLPYRYGYAADQGHNTTSTAEVVNGHQALARYDLHTGNHTLHDFGPGNSPSEPVFVPRHPEAAEDDGYLLTVVYRAAHDRSDLVILHAQTLDEEPVATLSLPHRVPATVHGNWQNTPGRR